MSAPASLRTKPVDRRRLSMEDRASYRPGKRMGAIARARAFKSNWSKNQQRKPFATEQKPGSGGFQAGRYAQSSRQYTEAAKTRRAESFRPEDSVSRDIYRELSN